MDLSTCPLLSETLSAFLEKPQDTLPSPRAREPLLAQGQTVSRFPLESAVVEFYLAVLNESGTDFFFFPPKIYRNLIIGHNQIILANLGKELRNYGGGMQGTGSRFAFFR